MSITSKQAEEMQSEVAVVCCRTEVDMIIEPEHLEDPTIFPDLIDAGLLKVPADTLKIGEVLGAKIVKTVDSLTPITPDIVKGAKEINFEEDSISGEEKAVLKYNKNKGASISLEDLENPMHFQKLTDSLLIDFNDDVLSRDEVIGKKLNKDVNALSPITPNMLEGYVEEAPSEVTAGAQANNGILKIKIAEGKGIDIELPLHQVASGNISYKDDISKTEEKAKIEEPEEKILRKLTRKHFQIDGVTFGPETKIDGTTLYIREDICKDAVDTEQLVVDMKIDIVTPDDYDVFSNTIMDVQPIATKEEGALGEGITRVIDGAVILVTGTDEKGVQIGEFGSSEGELERNIMWGRPGSPERGEILIKTDVTIKEGTGMERPGPLAVHKATDIITQEIRNALKETKEELVANKDEFVQKRRPGKKKIAIIKEIMGQGAMHDNLLLPVEPVGILGAKANVDLGNVPIVVSPLQVLDGCIHALTCIGPASKETSRHYWREPLVLEAMADEEIDFAGVIFVGSPQINSEKFYVSNLLGFTLEPMDLDGAVVTTEGFGNNHIDFASHIEQVGKRGISVVGATYSAMQGQLVAGNKYMDAMVDLNKSRQGIENEILENNCLAYEDAVRILYMLKAKMAGEEIIPAERSWNPEVKQNNINLIGKAIGKEIELADNETSLKISRKRKEIYEKDELSLAEES